MSNQTLSYMSWFYTVNLFTKIIASCQIVLGLFFILIILCNRVYQTMSNCLVANTIFSITLYAITVLIISVHMLECDNDPNQCIEDSSCFFREYINNLAFTAAIYSLTIQSIHHLLATLFLRNVKHQIYKLRLILCIIQWFIAFLYPVYFVYLHRELEYDSVSYVCVMSYNSSIFSAIYTLLIRFLIPVMITISVYIKLFLFVRYWRKSGIIAGISLPIFNKHELRITKRILSLLFILALGSLPEVISQRIKSIPDYHYRIYYLSMTIASFCFLLCLFIFTPAIKKWFIRWKKKIETMIHARQDRTIVPKENRY